MKSEEYYIYLRKSRTDREAEMHGEGETLARHERILMELARSMNLHITKVFREIVSGETISARPQMQELLSAVEQGRCTGVLVMEIERLARGNTKDQGIVAEAFHYGKVKIITPLKTYEPDDEFDEEYFEFGLFMSRREYKTINRRLQRGRTAAAAEGRYIAAAAPYGYRKVKIPDDKGYTLEVIPEQADTVRLIFRLYTEGEPLPGGTFRQIGMLKISRYLDDCHIRPPRGDRWSRSTVKDILHNITYTGKVPWQRRICDKKYVDGHLTEHRTRCSNPLISDGLHPPIISEAEFKKAARIMEQKCASHTPATSFPDSTAFVPRA